MSVIQDAFFLLGVIYKIQYLENQDLGSDRLAELVEFNHHRVLHAVKYLEGEQLIEKIEESDILLSDVRLTLRCTSKGVKVIENPKISENDYGIKFEINFITNVDIESLVKVNFDSVFKGTLF